MSHESIWFRRHRAFGKGHDEVEAQHLGFCLSSVLSAIFEWIEVTTVITSRCRGVQPPIAPLLPGSAHLPGKSYDRAFH